MFCFPLPQPSCLNGITGTYLFIKVVVQTTAEIFRAFRLTPFTGGNSHHRQILEFYYLLIASGFTNFGSLTELLAFDQGLLVFCFPLPQPGCLNGITGTYLFIKVVVYDGGQLFRPFSLLYFPKFVVSVRRRSAFQTVFTFVLLPGSKPTFVVLTQVTSKIAYYDGQF